MTYAPGWVEYTARNGDKSIERAVRLRDPDAIALALKCTDPDVCLDIFGDAHEFEPESDWYMLASWSFHMFDLHRLGVEITIRYVTDAEMRAKHAPKASP